VIACVAGWTAAAAGARFFGLWPTIGSAAVALGLVVLISGSRESRACLSPSPRLLLVGLVAGAVMACAAYLLYPPVVRLWPFVAQDSGRLYAAFRAPSPLIAALALPLVVAGEELVWRGAVQGMLVHRLGGRSGIVLAALAYALAIAPFCSPVLVAVSLTCGLAWGALRVASGSLVPTLVAHLLWDLAVLVWLPLDALR
jgi:membrane protease YdiL (CAAX protease family)